MAAVPRLWHRRWGQARADLVALVDSVRGRHPAPLVTRSERHLARSPVAAQASAASAARRVRVVERVMETRDAVSLVLEDPTGAELAVAPGQFFTVLLDIGGRSHRRAYSASGDCRDRRRVRLTIKRVTGGLVSNYINDHLEVGDELRVLGPSGNFVCATDRAHARHVVLVGGGSGVTPLMAIASAVLAGEPASRVSMIYGNRRVRDIIFLHDLDLLAAEEGDRFVLRHVLEDAPHAWGGGTGRLDRANLEAELGALRACDLATTYYLCGPAPMMAAAREVLLARGVEPSAIHEERFGSLATQPAMRTLPAAPQAATIHHAGSAQEVAVEPGQTLLDAGLAVGVPMKFSCAMGGCGACKVKLREGEVVMDEPSCLTDDERAAGYVLACVARPCTPVEIEVD